MQKSRPLIFFLTFVLAPRVIQAIRALHNCELSGPLERSELSFRDKFSALPSVAEFISDRLAVPIPAPKRRRLYPRQRPIKQSEKFGYAIGKHRSLKNTIDFTITIAFTIIIE